MGLTETEMLEYLIQARICTRIAREFIEGKSPFTKEQVLGDLEAAGLYLTTLILNHKHGGQR